MKRKLADPAQLSLFEQNEPPATVEPTTTTVFDFIRARLDRGPELTQEEYKRWIKILVQNSLKRID